jgi:hypothetical protein
MTKTNETSLPELDAFFTGASPDVILPSLKVTRKKRRMAREPGPLQTLADIGVVRTTKAPKAPRPAKAAKAPAAPRVTKASKVLELLEREGGATLTELMAWTGWLPHTTRAFLSGLRKKGTTLAKGANAEGITTYTATKAG